jgi:N6-adenosine-specific RNA methylase IME4
MAWSEICAMPVKDLALPDAWLFLWIPRAHAFALHVIEIEAVAVETGELVKARVAMPLAYAVSKAWGFDDYSTAFVWTKTDEDHPDEGGGAILVRDQDELLLMFKRGNGLPKPEKKFGSNHRERSRPLGHSTKPQFYRDMIASMAGEGVPCLELFARFDPDRPAPLGWDLWGNQSDEKIDGVRNEAADMESAAVSAAPAIGVDTAQISAGAANEKCLFESVFLEPFETTPGSTERDPLDIPEFLLRKRPQLDLGLVVSPKVDVVDNHVQTRLPVNAMELEEAVGLRAIHAGDHPGDIARHLVGMGWAGCTTKALFLTDEGRAALAAFVDMPASQSAKQPAFDGLSSCETEILT